MKWAKIAQDKGDKMVANLTGRTERTVAGWRYEFGLIKEQSTATSSRLSEHGDIVAETIGVNDKVSNQTQNSSSVLEPVREELRELAELFESHGHNLYIVGGIVRDAQAGLPLSTDLDLDLTTDAKPTTIKAILENWADALWTQGERFGTIAAKRGTRSIEITTHRSESYQPDSRKPQVRFSDSIEADLSRRDFTINAMAVKLPDGQIIDPFGGATDLKNRRLRTPTNPAATFNDDPLRMLRAARFVSRFDMTADTELVEAMTEVGERIGIVAHERIRDELDKLLALPNPVPAFELLFETGLADYVLSPIKDKNAALRRLSKVGTDPTSRLATLVACDGTVDQVKQELSKRRATTATIKDVSTILTSAHDAIQNPPRTLPELRRWTLATYDHTDQSLNVATTLGDIGTLKTDVDNLLKTEPDLTKPPILDGHQIMSLLDLEPGPEIGAAVKELKRHRADTGPLTAKQARSHLKKWYKASKDQ